MTPIDDHGAYRLTLDNLTLAHKEGLRLYAEAEPRQRPDRLTRSQISALSQPARGAWDKSRRSWHANLGPIKTAQLVALHEDLWDIVESNCQEGDKAKGAIALDAFPGLGKTTAVLAFAKLFHNKEILANGRLTDAGHERWPVCRIGLTGSTGMRDFNKAMVDFYGHPGSVRGTAAQFVRRALDCVLSCETKILIIDDMHFLRWQSTTGVEISNHLKFIAGEFPITLILIGVGLSERGLFTEGTSWANALFAQTGRRTTALGMEPFSLENDDRRHEWRDILLAVEQRLVLADIEAGVLADDLSDYMFERSSGHIGSLMTLVNRGCQRAIRTGKERLDRELLDSIKIDAAAETARTELAHAFAAGKLTTKPKRARRKRTRPSA